MLTHKNPTDPRSDPIFRIHMAAAIRQYGRNGLRILKNGQQFCTGCGRILPTSTVQRIQHTPVICDNCGRVIVAETDRLLPLFTVSFS